MKMCPYCRNVLRDDSAFCNVCGKRFSQNNYAGMQYQQMPYGTNANNNSYNNSYGYGGYGAMQYQQQNYQNEIYNNSAYNYNNSYNQYDGYQQQEQYEEPSDIPTVYENEDKESKGAGRKWLTALLIFFLIGGAAMVLDNMGIIDLGSVSTSSGNASASDEGAAEDDGRVRVLPSDYQMGGIYNITTDELIKRYNSTLGHTMTALSPEDSEKEHIDTIVEACMIDKNNTLLTETSTEATGKDVIHYSWNLKYVVLMISAEPSTGRVKSIDIGCKYRDLVNKDDTTTSMILRLTYYSMSAVLLNCDCTENREEYIAWLEDNMAKSKGILSLSTGVNVYYQGSNFGCTIPDSEQILFMISPISDAMVTKLEGDSPEKGVLRFVPLSERKLPEMTALPAEKIQPKPLEGYSDKYHFGYTLDEYLEYLNYYLEDHVDYSDAGEGFDKESFLISAVCITKDDLSHCFDDSVVEGGHKYVCKLQQSGGFIPCFRLTILTDDKYNVLSVSAETYAVATNVINTSQAISSAAAAAQIPYDESSQIFQRMIGEVLEQVKETQSTSDAEKFDESTGIGYVYEDPGISRYYALPMPQ